MKSYYVASYITEYENNTHYNNTEEAKQTPEAIASEAELRLKYDVFYEKHLLCVEMEKRISGLFDQKERDIMIGNELNPLLNEAHCAWHEQIKANVLYQKHHYYADIKRKMIAEADDEFTLLLHFAHARDKVLKYGQSIKSDISNTKFLNYAFAEERYRKCRAANKVEVLKEAKLFTLGAYYNRQNMLRLLRVQKRAAKARQIAKHKSVIATAAFAAARLAFSPTFACRGCTQYGCLSCIGFLD
jgi:hypothetical protein